MTGSPRLSRPPHTAERSEAEALQARMDRARRIAEGRFEKLGEARRLGFTFHDLTNAQSSLGEIIRILEGK